MEKLTLGKVLKCKSSGTFINTSGEYCRVSTWWERGTQKIQIIFAKQGEIAKRFAITTTSEKKCVKLLLDEGFQLTNF